MSRYPDSYRGPDGRPYLVAEAHVPLAAFGGASPLAGVMLTGECHRCGREVDHVRDAPRDQETIVAPVALISPPGWDAYAAEPSDSAEAFAQGWGMAPIHADCPES